MTDYRNKAHSAVVLIILSFFAHIAIFSNKVNMCISVKERLLLALLVIIFILPMHEFIHYVLMKFFGLKNVKIEIARDPLGFISLRTTAEGRVNGWKNVFILLGPLIVLTIVPDIFFAFSDKIGFMLWIMALANSVGSCYDILALIN